MNQFSSNADAIVLDKPGYISIKRARVDEIKPNEIAVKVDFSGISSGTERLLYEGRMPNFPGMGYPLIPGYETVGVVENFGPDSNFSIGDKVFVPGAKCFREYKSLFGGSASKLVVSSDRVCKIPKDTKEEGTLLALAATANHIFAKSKIPKRTLVVGHGTLGRLIAKIIQLKGGEPIVAESDLNRRRGNFTYEVLKPDEIKPMSFESVVDASGDSNQLNNFINYLCPGGEIVLAGFYDKKLSFDFPQAFIREAKIRVAAQWQPTDLHEVADLFQTQKLKFENFVTHTSSAHEASEAYKVAFNDSSCLKMVLDWRGFQ